MYSIAKDIGDILKQSGKTIATAESITGGLIASAFVSVPNSSGWFLQGCVTYSNKQKRQAECAQKTFEKYGAVSSRSQKKWRGHRVTSKYIGISTTGYAGPTGGTSKPHRHVYIGIGTKQNGSYRVRLLEAATGKAAGGILALAKD